ncbi:MAG: SO_0444 family Cu/Zn efflux transporter [Planctomycetota bacterium]|jgi:uncharacterized membrane protein YraQ (UPF0718 family)
MDTNLIWTVALLLLAGIAGAALPQSSSWNARSLHALVALSAGVFLGSVIHVIADVAMPELGGAHGHGHGGHGHDHGHGHGHGSGGIELWIGAALGFFGLLIVRSLLPTHRIAGAHRHDVHAVAWRVAYLGLALHAALAGVGLAPLIGDEQFEWGLVGSFAGHKATELLSLATLMRLANVEKGRAWVYLVAFAAVTPLVLVVSRMALMQSIGVESWVTGLAGGTFLYVAVFDLLPEAFHETDSRSRSLLLVLSGTLAGALLPGGDLSALTAVPALTFDVFTELAPFLLLGFAIAGLLSEWLDPAKLEPWLAGERFRSVATASVVGAPLPLCSCSVVPVAATLRNAGASRGATSSFLIATPETGVDSMAVTYGLMGPVMAIARPVAAVLSAIGVGALVGRFGKDEVQAEAVEAKSCCSHAEPEPEPEPEASSCCAHEAEVVVRPSFADRLRRATQHGFVQMVDDLALPLVLGVVAAGVLAALIPADALTGELMQGPLGYLAMLAIGLPIYVCASASTPLAATLIAKGLSPGAALVLLLAAPATNLGSLLVVSKLIGRRGLTIHLVALGGATVVCGVLLDLALLGFGWTVPVAVGEHVHLLTGPVHTVGAAILALLLLGTAWRKLRPGRAVEQSA